jgi:hypothetical protein
VSITVRTVMPSNTFEHSPIARGFADAAPVDPMASPSAMAEMATRVCACLPPRCVVPDPSSVHPPGKTRLRQHAAWLRSHCFRVFADC